MAGSETWSVTSMASRGNDEQGLEVVAVSGIAGVHVLLQDKKNQRCQRMRRRVGRRGKPEGEAGLLNHVDTDEFGGGFPEL
jgi:hypothetical protein